MSWQDEFKVGKEPTYSPTAAVIFVVMLIGAVLLKIVQYFN